MLRLPVDPPSTLTAKVVKEDTVIFFDCYYYD